MEGTAGPGADVEGGAGGLAGISALRWRGEARWDEGGEALPAGAPRRRGTVAAVAVVLAVMAAVVLCAAGWIRLEAEQPEGVTDHGVQEALAGRTAREVKGVGVSAQSLKPLIGGAMLASAHPTVRDIPTWAWPPTEDTEERDGGIELLWNFFQEVWVDIAKQRAAGILDVEDNCDPRDVVFKAHVTVYLLPHGNIDTVLSGLEDALRPSPAVGRLRFR